MRLPGSLGGGIVELDDEQQARLDEWAREARTDEVAGRVGGEKKPGGRHVVVPEEVEFDPGAEPCAVCGLRPGEGRIAFEASGGNRWYGRHKSAMERGQDGAEACEAAKAADRAYQTARTR